MTAPGRVAFVRFADGPSVRYAIVEGDRVFPIRGEPFDEWQATGEAIPLAEIRILPPTAPSKVLAVGRNYRSHAGDRRVPEAPEIFFKAPSAVIGHGDPIVLPEGGPECHHELEMVAVVGRRATRVPPERALEHVLGVTCGNDVSARDWQRSDLQWWRAKGSDTFAPCGPFVVSGIDYGAIDMELRVNGEVRQRQSTADMIFDVGRIVSWISRHVTLEPGDLIFTGTPGTTGPLLPGDVVEVELGGVGLLRNPVRGG
ncbi:MAG: fumarylacetoacetate hydrolase family protein [Thermoanaerobaculia bacterium]|nr:fumarylacetoacetate hydrolase family protein [Thermoanaerobaculia bacterium]